MADGSLRGGYESVKVLVTQSCLNLCDPVDCNPPVPLSTEFLRQEYWSGLPFTSPEELPNPGVDPGLLHCKKIVLPGQPKSGYIFAKFN